MNEVQALVDALAAELRRPTGVDDQRFRAIAYSSHSEAVDPVRVASILEREAPSAVREWLESLGVGRAEGPLRVSANPELAMSARVCLPLRFNDAPLGYLWLIDEPEPLTDAQLEEAERYAAELQVALYRERLLERDRRHRERELLALLFQSGPGEDPARAAAELVEGGHLLRAPAYAVLVLGAHSAERVEVPAEIHLRLVDAAERLRRAVAPRHALVWGEGPPVAVILAGESGEVERRGRALAALAAESIGDADGWSALVSSGEERASASALPQAFAEARAAAAAAPALGSESAFVPWSALGANRTLVELLGDRDDVGGMLPSSFERLLASDEAGSLVATLERYLDLGGDARAAAEALHLHRSSLYARLHRIEEIAGVDLHSGEDRLELHLALRLWRLAEGGYP